MSLWGAAAVAIWHDIALEGRDEFYAWHGREHMPERVGIPGFLRGRRYVACDAELEFFNLYEARTHEVVTGPAYRQRLNSPTPWTLSTVRHFRRVARSICRVVATFGQGQGGLVSTWRYDVPDVDTTAHIDALSERILPAIVDQRIVAGASLLAADVAASAVDTAERKARGEDNMIPRWIVIVEGWGDEVPFFDLCATMLSDPVLVRAGASSPAEVGTYRLQATACPLPPS